jgi:putative transposase
MRREGWIVNRKCVRRICREEAQDPDQGTPTAPWWPRRRAARSGQAEESRLELRLPFDRLEDGRQIKILPVVDNYTRECLAILVAFNITAKDVVALLERLVAEHGAPSFMRSDNGPEFIARAVKGWLENSGIVTDYIEPGSPWENSYSESFNSRFRDELLNAEILTTLLEARVLIEEHRQHYNRDRVHSSLGYRTPIEFAAQLNEEGVRKASAKGKSKTDGGRPRGLIIN